MLIFKKIAIFLACIYFLNILLVADSNKNEEWPSLFSGDVWFVYHYYSKYNNKYVRHEEIVSIDDEKMINSSMLTNDIKYTLMEWFKEGSGELKYDEEIAKKLVTALKQIASKVQEKIDNCKFLQNMYGEKIENSRRLGLSFREMGGACGETLGRSAQLHWGMLRAILRDIGEQMKNGVEKIQVNVSKYTCGGQKNNDIVTNMGHETLHAILGAGEPSNVDECVVHCLTKKCLAEYPGDYKIQDYVVNRGGNLKCNEISDEQWDSVIDRTGDVDPREEMKAGDCFCDEEWTEDADCDENKPNQPPPQGGSSSRTKKYAKVYLPDTPDDHYSYSDLVAFTANDFSSNAGGSLFEDTFKEVLSFSYYPDILIYSTYGNSLMENLLTKIMPGNFIDDYDHEYFPENHKA